MDERSFEEGRILFPEPPVRVDRENSWHHLGDESEEPGIIRTGLGGYALCGPFSGECRLSECEFEDEPDDDFDDELDDDFDGRPSYADGPVKEAVDSFWAHLAERLEVICGAAPKKVIFSGPATIAIWPSGDKVVAKCSGNDEYDREKGLMMCLLKKAYGSKAVDILEEWV